MGHAYVNGQWVNAVTIVTNVDIDPESGSIKESWVIEVGIATDPDQRLIPTEQVQKVCTLDDEDKAIEYRNKIESMIHSGS